MTKRVVVTGRGLVTPLGDGLAQNVQSLMDGKTGTVFMPEWREMGLDEIGVSKQAVFKKIKREPLSTSLQGLTATVDGRLMVEVDGEKLIKQAFSEIAPSTTDNQLTGAVDGLVDAPSTKNAEKTAEVDGVISVLQATIDTLQGQLEVKDRQIEQQAQTITRLTDALAAAQQTAAAAQALHAGTIQQQLITGEAGTDQQEPEQKKSWFSKIFGGR